MLCIFSAKHLLLVGWKHLIRFEQFNVFQRSFYLLWLRTFPAGEIQTRTRFINQYRLFYKFPQGKEDTLKWKNRRYFLTVHHTPKWGANAKLSASQHPHLQGSTGTGGCSSAGERAAAAASRHSTDLAEYKGEIKICIIPPTESVFSWTVNTFLQGSNRVTQLWRGRAEPEEHWQSTLWTPLSRAAPPTISQMISFQSRFKEGASKHYFLPPPQLACSLHLIMERVGKVCFSVPDNFLFGKVSTGQKLTAAPWAKMFKTDLLRISLVWEVQPCVWTLTVVFCKHKDFSAFTRDCWVQQIIFTTSSLGLELRWCYNTINLCEINY